MFAFKFSYLCLIIPAISANSTIDCILSLPNFLSILQSPPLNRDTLPPGYQTTKDLIIANGFGYKEYKVETEDGYILRVHRIIGKKPGGHPVLFSHGLSTSSESFLVRGRKYSLAFQLVDEGLDVWLYDRRGNWYSREHVKYKPNTREFWDFSFHESGCYDATAVIDHILKLTEYSQVFFIGHSMGATDFAVMASERPEYNDKVKLAIFFGPTWIVPTIPEVSSIFLRFTLVTFELFYQFAKRAAIYEVCPKHSSLIEILDKCCDPSSFQGVCVWAYKNLVGDHGNNLNKTEFQQIITHWPGGASLKTFHHMNQIFKFGFAQYNYGVKENLIRYQNVTPPLYPLDKVTSPIAIIWGKTDPFFNERTTKEIKKHFPNIVENYEIEQRNFNHGDYVFSSKSKYLVNSKVIKLIKRFL